MDLRLATEAFARFSLSAPSCARPARRIVHGRRQLPFQCMKERHSSLPIAQRRCMSSTQIRCEPPAGAAAARQPDPEPEYERSYDQSSNPQPSEQPPQHDPDLLESVVDEARKSRLQNLRRQPSGGQSSSRKRNVNQQSPESTSSPQRRPPAPDQPKSYFGRTGRTIADKLQSEFEQAEKPRSREPPQRYIDHRPPSARDHLADMQMPERPTTSSSSSLGIEDLFEDYEYTPVEPDKSAQRTKYPAPQLNFNASTGRSVSVNPNRGIDAARAISMMEMRLAQNKVKSDLRKQKFHERPGLKRKRLASERYRRRFKAGFTETLREVREMGRKGW